MSYNDNKIEFNKLGKGYYEIRVNGVEFGTWERSQIRQFIEEWDKQVNG